MLYILKDKIYVKPFDNKVVEVSIEKKADGYDVKAIKSPLELNKDQLQELISITIDDAYKFQKKAISKKMLDE